MLIYKAIASSDAIVCLFESITLPDLRILFMIDFFHEHVVRAGEEAYVVIEGLVDHKRFAGFGVRGDTDDAIWCATRQADSE